jgi:hypothetical protein
MLASFVAEGCNKSDAPAANSASNTAASKAKDDKAAVKPNEDGTIPSGTGVEKEKPEAGKANVQGKAFYNDKPAAAVEVKLCSKFSQYGTGCGGEIFTAKTDDAGEYLIKNVPAGMYEGLTVKVFDTPYYVFATSGYISAAKYDIPADKTYFAPDTNLFKNDVKVTSPKAGSTVAPDAIALKWDAYADAAYYKLSINADSSSGAETVYDFINKRVDDPGFTLDKPLKTGKYSIRIDAFNANDRKLAQSSSDIKFTVK